MGRLYMEFLLQVIQNRILWCGVSAWLIAQILKAISNVVITGKFSWERLFGDGGMPSGHSATVSAVMLSTGLYAGFDSAVFAVSAILAIIVMHDAMNVRLESGKQAHLLNIMAETFEELTGTAEKTAALRTLMSHYAGRTDWTMPEDVVKRTCVFCLTVTEISGRAHG